MRTKVPLLALTGVLLLVAMVLAGSAVPDVQAATPTELFFSEYIEGSSNNKALEIYNGTGSAVDLTDYNVQMFFNGSSSAGLTIDLVGSVADGDVFVVAHSSADPAILAQADQTNGSGWFNGDDAVVLNNNSAVVDSIGQVGFDPGSYWGSGDVTTQNHTLGRMEDICGGDTDATDTFDPAIEWDGYPQNTFDRLGAHTANCDGGPSAPRIVINEIMNNPAAVADSAGEWFELYNAGSSDVDIEGWTIRDDDFDSHVIANGSALLVPAGGYIVLGNNADSGTNGGADVAYSYGGDMFLSNGGDEVILIDTGGVEVDRVEYDGGPVFPDPNGASMSLEDPALDNNDGTNWCTSTTPFGDGDLGTPGAMNVCDGGGGPDPLAVFIHEVQGSGDSVAITDRVIVEAVVVGDFQSGDQLLGFFIQEEDEDADGDDATSEGILVFCGACTPDVNVGDLVQVTGWPGEYFGMSQIDAAGSDSLVTVVSSGQTLPSASSIALPAVGSTTAESTFENVEGMLVTFPYTLVVSEYFQLARFGQLVLTLNEREHQFTDANEPDADGYAAFLADLSTRRIILDDDNNDNNSALGSPDEPYYWPREGLSITNLIRGGDTINNLTGVLHWSWAGGSNTNAWRVRPVLEAVDYDFTPVIPRPDTPSEVGGSLKVASFNVLNYFKTIDLGPDICGPAADLDCRGAHSESELTRQRNKIVAAMLAMDADVLGLMELENDADASIAHLVEGLNAVTGPGTYDYIATGFIGEDAIKVGFIYKTATVDPVGSYAILDSTVDPTFNDDKNRPALAQTFDEIATGGRFTAVVNHLKSKGSSCNDVGDPNLNDGQANCPQTRTDAANALVNWLATDPTASGDPDFMILGDLNAYRMEDPIAALQAGGYTDLLDALIGPEAYTYLFDGQLGYLDYIMTNGNMFGQVTGVTAWNINADEIPLFDYNDEIQDPGEASFERESDAEPIYEANAYRASDHDPVIAGLDLNGPPVCSTAVPDPEELWPANHKFVPVSVAGVTDPDGDVVTITIDSIFQDEPVMGRGDGKTTPDGQGVGTDTAWLRAERSGRGNGRAYHVTFTADDGQFNSCSGEVIVFVPKSQGKYGPAIDDGPLYDSTQP